MYNRISLRLYLFRCATILLELVTLFDDTILANPRDSRKRSDASEFIGML